MDAAPDWQPWRRAWQRALYGPSGFYTRARPVDHFRTSVHASPLFAGALVTIVRERGLSAVVDLGAGDGELLEQVHGLAPDLRLAGVELRPRPSALSAGIGWCDTLPADIDGLLVANELLDNVACDVVERDLAGRVRHVEVRASTGAERLGPPVGGEVAAWVEQWWPLTEAGQRAEVGLARDEVWAAACGRVRDGVCLAIDYGHLRSARPATSSLASYRRGRRTALRLDGDHDVAAPVAMDSLAARVGGTLATQRDLLATLGISGRRPPLALAATDPAAYVRALASATQAAELTEVPGLGEFHWLLTPRRQRRPV